MQFCQTHWSILREEIARLGLSDWIAPSAEVAVEQLINSTQQGNTRLNFDPLMASHNAVVTRSLQVLGPQIFRPDFGCALWIRSLGQRIALARAPDASTPSPDQCPHLSGGLLDPREHLRLWLII